jgi:hypothetical protein
LPRPNQQPKTTLVGVVLLSVRRPHHHHHNTLGPITIRAVLDNLGTSFWVCNLGLTQLDEIRKTTSIVLEMEDDLNFLKMEDDLIFLIWKTTSDSF